jgi:hypothetical protein
MKLLTLSYWAMLLVLAGNPTSSKAVSTDIPLDPRATYLHMLITEFVPVPIDLELLGIAPGDTIGLETIGDFQGSASTADTATPRIGIFSASNIILAKTNLHRIPDAIDAGDDYVTSNTFLGGEPTDVDEDFFIDDILITVPAGAAFLFLAVPDSHYVDNSDPDGDCAVRITYTPRNENIDPDHSGNQFAWSENTGWINFDTDVNPGVLVTSDKVIGYAWGENIGWINLSCENNDSCGAVDYGVVNDGMGHLSGFAWGENVGWINFDPNVPGDPTDYGVTVDDQGAFDGWAWAQNIGWINFGIADHYVVACKVTLPDLINFANDWLEMGGGFDGDLNDDDGVDNYDYAILATWWLDFCPHAWPL